MSHVEIYNYDADTAIKGPSHPDSTLEVQLATVRGAVYALSGRWTNGEVFRLRDDLSGWDMQPFTLCYGRQSQAIVFNE